VLLTTVLVLERVRQRHRKPFLLLCASAVVWAVVVMWAAQVWVQQQLELEPLLGENGVVWVVELSAALPCVIVVV
jgi:hypothetical protein